MVIAKACRSGCAALLLLLALPCFAEVLVTIDRNPVQVNESFQIVFSADNTPDRDPDFSPLQNDFLVIGNSRSNSISIINGEYQRSVKWTLKLMAKQIGEYKIPAIRFDKELSEPFVVTVKESSLATLPHDQLVLELLADRSEVTVQSQVILTLRLLSATDISAYQFGDIVIESLDAVIEPLGDVRQYQTRIADKSYLVLEKQVALFPQQSGRFEVTPVRAEVRLPSRSSGFDPFRTGGEVRQVRSPGLAIEVLPIPTAFDGPFWLPADRVELREEWSGDLATLVAGEPITRSLTLRAEGLTAAQLPELSLPVIDGIKQYPDQPALDNTRSSNGISGQRLQKVALLPGAPGRYRLPEIRVPWWNRQSGRMEVATLPARELLVAAAPAAAVAEAALDTEIATTNAPATPPPSRFWLWLSLLLACGWTLHAGYWWWRSRFRRRAAEAPQTGERPNLRRTRKALRQACADNDASAARSALLAWGQALLAPRRVDNLNRLERMLGSELGAEIERLNQSLYASPPAPWQGANLWQLCAGLEATETAQAGAAPSPLAPLNP